MVRALNRKQTWRNTEMRTFSPKLAIVLFLAVAVLPLAASEPVAQPLFPFCESDPCQPGCPFDPSCGCTPSFQLAGRQVTSITYIQKKPNGVCVYECTANDTFTDANSCPGSENFTTAVQYRVRPYYGEFPCPEEGEFLPGFCCDTSPQPSSCSW